MDYNNKKTELLNKQTIVLQKHKELLREVCELVVGLQNLLENNNNSMDETVEWIRYMSQDKDVDKSFRLAAALQYAENPSDIEVVQTLKNDMKLNRVKAKKYKEDKNLANKV